MDPTYPLSSYDTMVRCGSHEHVEREPHSNVTGPEGVDAWCGYIPNCNYSITEVVTVGTGAVTVWCMPSNDESECGMPTALPGSVALNYKCHASSHVLGVSSYLGACVAYDRSAEEVGTPWSSYLSVE